MSYFIEKGADFDFERTHLHIVQSIRHPGIVQYHIERCDIVEAKDKDQCTSLYYGCKHGHFQIVQ